MVENNIRLDIFFFTFALLSIIQLVDLQNKENNTYNIKKVQFKMNQNLLNGFAENTFNDWLKAATIELKGKSFQESLVWMSYEGIEWQPFYDASSLNEVPIDAIQKAQNKEVVGWKNRITLQYTTEKETNEQLVQSLRSGGESASIVFDATTDISTVNLSILLKDCKLSDFSVYFHCHQPLQLLQKLIAIFPYFLKGGVFFSPEKTETSVLSDALHSVKEFKDFKLIDISSEKIHLQGASATQEIAHLAASMVSFLERNKNVASVEQLLKNIQFSTFVSTNYFLEIAKIRALRYVLQKIVSAYIETPFEAIIHAKTSPFVHSNYSSYTNILRTTTETMSAAIGGSNSIEILPFDAFSATQNQEFSLRIARNISLLLKEEAYLDKTNDPAAGSYFIEKLTFELIQKSWDLFLEIEKLGGSELPEAQHFLNEKVQEVLAKKLTDYKNGKILVGINKFISPTENQAARPDLDFQLIEERLNAQK